MTSWRTGRTVMQRVGASIFGASTFGMSTFGTSVMAGALALTALLLDVSSAARADDQLKVAIGQINNWENQMPTLGQDAGIFKKYGLVLDNFGTAGAGGAMQPLIAGRAAIGIGGGVAGGVRGFSEEGPGRRLPAPPNRTRARHW